MHMGQLFNRRTQRIKLTKLTGVENLEVIRGISNWYLQHGDVSRGDNINPQSLETGNIASKPVPSQQIQSTLLGVNM